MAQPLLRRSCCQSDTEQIAKFLAFPATVEDFPIERTVEKLDDEMCIRLAYVLNTKAVRLFFRTRKILAAGCYSKLFRHLHGFPRDSVTSSRSTPRLFGNASVVEGMAGKLSKAANAPTSLAQGG